MRFQIPQFIETETTIVGPLTFRQFIWVGMGVGLILMLFRFLTGFWFIFTSVIVVAIFGSLAFLKIEGMTLIEYILKAFNYGVSPKKYLFKKEQNTNY